METNTKQAQGLFVVLPEKEVVTDIGGPYDGDYYYYSGAGNYLDNMMYKAFSLPAGATLTAMVKYEIELDWDYAYLVYSTDGGATWAASAKPICPPPTTLTARTSASASPATPVDGLN